MSQARSQQGNRVQLELEALRQKQLTKAKRDKLKDCTSFCSVCLSIVCCFLNHTSLSSFSLSLTLRFHTVCSAPLTTPEDAKAFLASMRDKSHQREFSHQPPSNLSADGMDTWFLQQRQHQKELRERRREAEELLRGYRGGRESLGGLSSAHSSRGGRWSLPDTTNDSHSPTSQAPEEDDDDDRSPRNVVEAAYPRDSLDDPETSRIHVDDTGFLLDSTPNGTNENKQQLSQEEALDDPKGYLQENRSNGGRNDDATKAPATVWLDFISNEPGAKFPPQPNRYHLYLSFACPGSHRVLIVRALKGLEDVISVSYVHPTWKLTGTDKHRGWVFGDPSGEPFANTIARGGPFPAAYPDNEPDPYCQAKSIRDIYESAGDTAGKYTIPILWDTQLRTIVNNESSDIAYMLNSCFNDYCNNPDLDLYTEYDDEGVAKLNEVSEWLSPLMIHGVYRCGFAKNQRAYDKAIAELCQAFDKADDILQTQRFLTGNDTITDADIRLFVSLIRFDEVYAVYFKANARLVMLTPSLLNFCRELYQLPGVAATCRMDQIKAHFYGSHAEWNKYSVIPRGLGFMELLGMPHDRELVGTLETAPTYDEEI